MNMRNAQRIMLGIACQLLFFFSVIHAMAQEVTIIKNTMIGRLGEAQVEIECPDGFRLLFDVADPDSLSMPVSSKDILLTTHLHSDHYIEEFCAAFPGKQLRMEKGQISLQNLVIKSIPASHSNKWPTESTADNFIFIIDIGNLRIVNLGDIEQETFMPEQLRELENIDVLITMLYYSANIDLTNQLKPRIVIPTHIWGSPIMKSLVQQWPAYRWKQDSFVVRRDSLPAETNLLLIGDWGERLGSMYKVPEWHRR